MRLFLANWFLSNENKNNDVNACSMCDARKKKSAKQSCMVVPCVAVNSVRDLTLYAHEL